MEKNSSAVLIEELKAKPKNTSTTNSTYQWLRVYLSCAKLRIKEQETEKRSLAHWAGLSFKNM